ncbi:hypothetical protein GCM10027168_03880 [Streptomyces capparidis]
MKPAFPYPTLFGDIALEVMAVTVDGAELPYSNISKSERTVALHRAGREKWDMATLRLKATLPEREIAEGPWSDLACLAVLSEKATNARVTARLAPDGDGHLRGSIEVHRDLHLSRATLSLTLVGTVGGVVGRVIGATKENWYVDLKLDTPVRHREVEIVRTDFREGPYEWLRPFKESPWIVDTTGDIPTVYLNVTAVEGLTEVLDGTGGTTAEKLLRETTAGQIAQDAWIAMFHSAISDLELDEDGTPVMPTGWRESVLRMMLPDVLPGRQLTDALYEIDKRRVDGFGWSELQTGIHHAAGRRSRLTRRLTSAVRSVEHAESD